jgi:hypothetical protein
MLKKVALIVVDTPSSPSQVPENVVGCGKAQTVNFSH